MFSQFPDALALAGKVRAGGAPVTHGWLASDTRAVLSEHGAGFAPCMYQISTLRHTYTTHIYTTRTQALDVAGIRHVSLAGGRAGMRRAVRLFAEDPQVGG